MIWWNTLIYMEILCWATNHIITQLVLYIYFSKNDIKIVGFCDTKCILWYCMSSTYKVRALNFIRRSSGKKIFHRKFLLKKDFSKLSSLWSEYSFISLFFSFSHHMFSFPRHLHGWLLLIHLGVGRLVGVGGRSHHLGSANQVHRTISEILPPAVPRAAPSLRLGWGSLTTGRSPSSPQPENNKLLSPTSIIYM